MNIAERIERYLDGPATLRRYVEGLSADELDSIPIPGQWSIRQVVCHLTDSEILYADRMKRILAEHEPPLMNADPESFLAALQVAHRDLEDELQLIVAIRTHVGQILKPLLPEQFARIGIHSTDGPMTLAAALERAANHLPHHVTFIAAKSEAIKNGRGRC